jgi:hypothetical protein
MTNLTHNSFFLYVYFNPLHVSSNLVEDWKKNKKKELCIKLVIYQNYTEMHGQQNIKHCAIRRAEFNKRFLPNTLSESLRVFEIIMYTKQDMRPIAALWAHFLTCEVRILFVVRKVGNKCAVDSHTNSTTSSTTTDFHSRVPLQWTHIVTSYTHSCQSVVTNRNVHSNVWSSPSVKWHNS